MSVVGLGSRVLLPNFKMTLVRTVPKLSPYRLIKDPSLKQVAFHIEPRMNKIEVKHYLESIYNVKVNRVETQNILGKAKRTRLRGVVNKQKIIN